MNKILYLFLSFLLLLSCSDITSSEKDIQPPGQIEIKVAVHHNHNFTVVWNQCTDQDFKEYMLYMGNSPDTTKLALAYSSTNISDTLALIPDIDYYRFYYYQLVIIDDNGNIAKSNIHEANSYPVVVFVSDRTGSDDIFLVDYFGKFQYQLTYKPGYDAWPIFSSDGSKFVFETDRDGNIEIYCFDFTNFQAFNLTNDPAHDIDPCVTADGERILFISNRTGGRGNVFRVKLDGSYLGQITYKYDKLKFPYPSPINYEYTVVAQSGEIYYSNIGTSELLEIAQLPEYTGMAQISPDGKEVAVGRYDPESMFSELYFIDIKDGSIKYIYEGYTAIYSPTYPIVYYFENNRLNERYLISDTTRILRNDLRGYMTSISSDGEVIILILGMDNQTGIYRMNRNGENLVNLTSDNYRERFAKIQPFP